MSATGTVAGALPAAEADPQFAIDTIRCLAMDAVEAANSGHPGLPLAMAPVACLIYSRFLRYDPSEPDWPDRDRFILSAGHGSMLLYATLHLAGYDLPLDELKRFRQWGSRTPGHPEHGLTPGVETTTGPLGQGFANGVGMALAERYLRDRYGAEICDHRIYAICSDGDLMEGISAEAASLAGHLGLGRLIYLYDDNQITIDGATDLAFAGEDVGARFRAYGWHVQSVGDANDLDALTAAITSARDEAGRPSLICVRSEIGYPAPTKRGTPRAHGAPLGADEVRATKQLLGFDPELTFAVRDEAYAAFLPARTRGGEARRRWHERVAHWSNADPDLAQEWRQGLEGGVPELAGLLPVFDPSEQAKLSTRVAGAKVMAALQAHLPNTLGGSADLIESTKTVFPDGGSFSALRPGRNVHWGVREHAMGAAVNGLALHGGIVKPFGSTFLVFADYMRPAIRLSALMDLGVLWIFTHDSVSVGEDGPTHQPVEHVAALRAIPNLVVIRPADANETVQAWRFALEYEGGPVALVLTRQDLPVLAATAAAGLLARGAYVLHREAGASPDLVLVATGSEVSVALDAAELLAQQAIDARVVTMPSWELFDRQSAAYREDVIPRGIPSISVEAGIEQGWSKYVEASVSIDRFGASAPAERLLVEFGITAIDVVVAALELVAR
jgi:transketolase